MPTLWTLKSLVLFLNAGKRRKRAESRPVSKSFLRRNRQKEQPPVEIRLPDEIWSKICSHLSPLELIQMRRVSKQLNGITQQIFQSLLYLDVLRCDTAEVVEDRENDFHRIRKTNLFVHLDERSAILVVDEHWTSRDVLSVWGGIQFFAPFARCLSIDVSLVELMVAALSSVKLTRWYAFQCYVNAVGPSVTEELHMKCPKTPQQRNILFPKLTEFTVRTLPDAINALSRLPDYGVLPDALFSTEIIEMVRCSVAEPIRNVRLERTIARLGAKRPHHHLRVFRSWVQADSLKEKYVQHYTN